MDQTVDQPAAEREPDHVTPDPCPVGDPDCETGDDGSCHDGCTAPGPDGLTAEQIEDDRIATGLDDADDHFVIGQTSAGWPGTDLMSTAAPVLTHHANHGASYTRCGIDLVDMPFLVEDPAALTCSVCAGKVVDEQLAEPAPVANLPRTVSLEVINDELRALLRDETERANAHVGIVVRVDGRAVVVPDTDAPWRLVHNAWPIKILRGLLSEMISGRSRLEHEDGIATAMLMPSPDVLAALDGRPDAQLLTAPVWVLAMDIKAGMLLRSTDDDADGAETLELVTAERDCDDPECIHGATCIVLTVGGHEDPDVHFNGYSRVEVRIPCAVTR